MYIHANTETGNDPGLSKGENILAMISYEIERILELDDLCENIPKFIPQLKEIQQFANQYSETNDIESFIQNINNNVFFWTDDFSFDIYTKNHLAVNIKYTRHLTMWSTTTTYTSIIEHIDDIFNFN